jgi:hypothetical protein
MSGVQERPALNQGLRLSSALFRSVLPARATRLENTITASDSMITPLCGLSVEPFAASSRSTSGRWGFGRPRDAGLPEGLGGPAGLWHFLYCNAHVDQYVASEYSPPLNTRAAQKR